MSTFGTLCKISLFGESHGKLVGITISQLPAGFKLDLSSIESALSRRRPSESYASARKEPDQFRIVSGLHEGKTTGSPLTVLIDHTDVIRDSDDALYARPSHADYAAFIKYHGANDPSGGGHLSGRLTAPLVILGDIARQYLANHQIIVLSHVASIGHVKAMTFEDTLIDQTLINSLSFDPFPTLSSETKLMYLKLLEDTKKSGDSIGGTVETMITGLPVGLGEPYFDGLDSILAHLVFSIPGVKGLAYGKGFDLSTLYGSQSNDALMRVNNQITFLKNDMGGLTGGLTTSQPVLFSTAIKPTPTIHLPQKTIHLKTKENLTHTFGGRHDVCIVPRVLHVINALTYYAVFESMLRNGGFSWIRSTN